MCSEIQKLLKFSICSKTVDNLLKREIGTANFKIRSVLCYYKEVGLAIQVAPHQGWEADEVVWE